MAFYLGINGASRLVFKSVATPTKQTHGQFNACIGPFRTKRAATWAAAFGMGNPHFRQVSDAERIARV